jgi:hypothetical protein
VITSYATESACGSTTLTIVTVVAAIAANTRRAAVPSVRASRRWRAQTRHCP